MKNMGLVLTVFLSIAWVEASLGQIPTRLWSTYYGGSVSDRAYSTAVDANGNVYLSGMTTSSNPNMIATAGSHQSAIGGGADAFIAKFDASGTRIWGTYFGGPGEENPADIAVDPSGNVIITGETKSTSGIATAGSHQSTYAGGSSYKGDGYIAKFSPSGTLLWATYYGGSSDDDCRYVGTDSQGNIIAGGITKSSGGIASSGAHQTALAGDWDAFLVKFAPDGTRLWGTYYGGGGMDWNGMIAVDNNDNILFQGHTNTSTPGVIATPGTHQSAYGGGSYDHFVAKFTPVGNRLWGTYYGGAGNEWDGFSLATDASGNIFFTGTTNSSNGIASSGAHQTTPGGGSDAYAVKLDANGVRLWGTYYGGSGTDYPSCRRMTRPGVNGCFLAGSTSSSSGIATANGYQTSLGGGTDAFIVKFNENGVREWGTYYGGPGNDDACCLDFAGGSVIYLSGYTSSATSISFNGHQMTYGGNPDDGFLVKFQDVQCTGTVQITPAGPVSICPGDSVVLDAGAGFASYLWSPGGDVSRFKTVRNSGAYVVVVEDAISCKYTDTVFVNLKPRPTAFISGSSDFCDGDSITLSASQGSGYEYQWYRDNVPISGATTRILNIRIGGIYTVNVTDTSPGNGCDSISLPVNITVYPKPIADAGLNVSRCPNDPPVQIGPAATGGTGPYLYRWSPGAGLSDSAVATPYAAPAATTTYFVAVTDNNGCVSMDSLTVTVKSGPDARITGDSSFCTGDSTTLHTNTGAGYVYQWLRDGSPIPGADGPALVVTQAGYYSVIVTDSSPGNGCIDTSNATLVTVLLAPTAVISGDTAICDGEIGVLRADTGAGYRYQWYRDGTAIPGATANTIAVNLAGAYTLVVFNAVGCRDSSSVKTVTVIPLPRADIQGRNSVCPNSRTGYRAASGSGYSYAWIAVGGTIENGQNSDSITVKWGGAGEGMVSVRVTYSGCSIEDSLKISIQSAIVPEITLSPGWLCSGGSIQLDAGSGYVKYDWNTNPPDTTRSIVISRGGKYIVKVVDADGCEGADTVTVVEQPLPVPVITSVPANPCEGDTVILSVAQNYARYRWSTRDTTRSIAVTTGGVYTVQVDNDTCESEITPVSVTLFPRPTADVSGPAGPCVGKEITYKLAGSSGGSIEWSVSGNGTIDTGQGTPEIRVRWSSIGDGWVRVVVREPGNPCEGADTMQVTVGTEYRPTVLFGKLDVCTGDSVVLSVQESYSSYQWRRDGVNIPGAVNDTLVVSSSGTYTVFVEDPICQGTSQPVTITVRPLPIPVINGGADTLYICKDSSIVLRVDGLFSSYTNKSVI